MFHDRPETSWDECRRDDALALGRVIIDGISFFGDQILRVRGSPKIELKGMAQRYGGHSDRIAGMGLWLVRITAWADCAEISCTRRHWTAWVHEHGGWKNAWDAEAEAARLGQSLHEWRAGRTSSEVNGQG